MHVLEIYLTFFGVLSSFNTDAVDNLIIAEKL